MNLEEMNCTMNYRQTLQKISSDPFLRGNVGFINILFRNYGRRTSPGLHPRTESFPSWRDFPVEQEEDGVGKIVVSV